MAYSNFRNGFNVQTASAIDKRIYLSKAEMKAETMVLPSVYFAICTDDGKLYLYNKNNTVDSETGKYRVVEDNLVIDGGLIVSN